MIIMDGDIASLCLGGGEAVAMSGAIVERVLSVTSVLSISSLRLLSPLAD